MQSIILPLFDSSAAWARSLLVQLNHVWVAGFRTL
jgi:hypothetical protein